MSRRVIQVLLTLGACGALSCDRPTEPTLGSPDAEAPPARFAIVDAVHQSGNPYFFFLSPLVADPTSTGTFDATVLGSLAVDVCALGTSGCAGSPIKHFTSSSGTTLERIRVDATRKYFLVYWNTGESVVDPAKNYRIRVLTGSALLALIDVDVVPNAAALAAVNRTQFAGVVKGDWLPIRFRIDQGALTYNTPPTVAISAPTGGAHFKQGATITFTGSATDAQDGDLSAQIQWKADSTLVLGTGASVSATLPVGAHVVTASATDSKGARGQATVNLIVDANQAPTATITAPPTGTSVNQGVAVTFTGSATDPEDGTLGGASLAWSSSLDGALGTGATLTKSDLSVGMHTITLTATDSRGAIGTATITLNIGQSTGGGITLPATLTVPYVHDVTIPVQLPHPAPPGGVTVSLTSSDPARVNVSTPTVIIPAGAPSGSGTLHGAAPGTATITASGAGYGSGTSTVRTTASLKIPVSSMTLGPGPVTSYTSLPIQLQSMGAPVAAPTGGITIDVRSSDHSCVVYGSPQFIPAGGTSTSAPIRWGIGGSPLPCTAFIKVSAPDVTSDSVPVTVTAAPLLRFGGSSVVVGSGLENGGAAIQLATPAPAGGVVVHLASDDSTLLLLAPAFDFSTPGTGTLDLRIAAGGSMAFFNVQGMEARTGLTRVRATAPGYAGDSIDATVQRPAFQIVALPASMISPSRVAFQVLIGIEWQSLNGPSLATMSIRAGASPVTATITNSAPAVAQLVTFGPVFGQTGTVQIGGVGIVGSPAGGAAAHGIELKALGPGSTTVTASIPGWFAFGGATRTVTVH